MLLHDHTDLRGMLKYHIVRGVVTSEDVRRLGSVRSLEGRELNFYKWGQQTTVNGALIVKPDIWCKNGVIHTEDLYFQISRISPKLPPAEQSANVDMTLEEVERQHIRLVLSKENGKVDRAAAKLGIPRSSLYVKLKHFGIIA